MVRFNLPACRRQCSLWVKSTDMPECLRDVRSYRESGRGLVCDLSVPPVEWTQMENADAKRSSFKMIVRRHLADGPCDACIQLTSQR